MPLTTVPAMGLPLSYFSRSNDGGSSSSCSDDYNNSNHSRNIIHHCFDSQL